MATRTGVAAFDPDTGAMQWHTRIPFWMSDTRAVVSNGLLCAAFFDQGEGRPALVVIDPSNGAIVDRFDPGIHGTLMAREGQLLLCGSWSALWITGPSARDRRRIDFAGFDRPLAQNHDRVSIDGPLPHPAGLNEVPTMCEIGLWPVWTPNALHFCAQPQQVRARVQLHPIRSSARFHVVPFELASCFFASAENGVYALDSHGTLWCFDDVRGEVQWQLECLPRRRHESPPVIHDGWLIASGSELVAVHDQPTPDRPEAD